LIYLKKLNLSSHLGYRARELIPLALIFFSALALFFPVWSFEYLNFDDNIYVYQNPQVLSGLSWSGLKWAFFTTLGGHWHPLTWLSLMLDCDLFGRAASGWQHGENVILHSSSGVLFYLLLRQWSINYPIALVCSLIFTMHPMRIESIAWVSQRKDCLSTFFFLLTLSSYTYWIKKSAKAGYFVALTTLALGLLAKPTIVTTPLLLILLHRGPLCRYQLRWFRLTPFFTLCLVSALFTWLGQVEAGAVKGGELLSWDNRLANSGVHYLGYLGKLILPTTTGIFYPLQTYPPGLAVSAWLSLGMLSFLIFYSFRRELIVGWLWFLLSFAPVCGIIQVGGQSITDRWSYIPHLGLLMGVAGFLSHEKFKSYNRIAILTLSLGLVYCTLITRIELPNWQNSETVFKHSIANNANNFMAHNNLGFHYDSLGRLEDAHRHYQEAVRLAPHYPLALNNLGSSLARLGQLSEAKEAFSHSLSIAPNLANTHYNYGLLLYQEGLVCEALDHWSQTLHLDENSTSATNSLLYAVKNSSAIASCSEILEVNKRLSFWHPSEARLISAKEELNSYFYGIQ
jgi:protein O-mannosyl-transferase